MLETQVIIAKDIGYIKEESSLLDMTDKVFGLLGGLINSIKKRNK